jgi:hypothetical protein
MPFSTGVGVLVETMEQNRQRITDLDLSHNPLGQGASLLAQVFWDQPRYQTSHAFLFSMLYVAMMGT